MMALLVIGLVPLIWSAVIFGVRQMAGRRDIPQDRIEKSTLALILMPVFLGASLMSLARYMPITVTMPVLTHTGLDDDTTRAITATAIPAVSPHMDWPALSLNLVAAIYLIGAASGVARLLWAQFRLCRIVTTSLAAPEMGEGVRLTHASVPAFVFRRSIILPHPLLTRLTPTQITLIIAHERAHLTRGDTVYFAVLSWIDAVFWFNPFVRSQTRYGRLAAELACDAAVTDQAPQMRKTYAASLLMALKHTAGDVRQYAPAAIPPTNSGEFQMRLSEIMHASPPARKPRWVMLGAAALLILPLAGLQLVWAQTTAPKIVKASLVKATMATVIETPARQASIFTVVPTAGNLTSGYGMRLNPVTHKHAFHDGVDISAAIGTPVYAPASGKITRADLAEPGYGKVMIIDHGNGLITRYMHLGEFAVHVGDTVQAGQLIAKSGNSGRTTGPHTHIGVFKNGKPIDPATVMPLPAAS